MLFRLLVLGQLISGWENLVADLALVLLDSVTWIAVRNEHTSFPTMNELDMSLLISFASEYVSVNIENVFI